MNTLKILVSSAFLLAAMLPVAQADHAGHDRPAARYTTDRYHGKYDRYRYADSHYSARYRPRHHSPRYRYRPGARYVYRPLVAPPPYVRHRHLGPGYGPFRHHYGHRGDGIRFTPWGVTIFLDLDD